MKIARGTVFKVLMLAGVFSCALVLASVFACVTAFAHDEITGSHDGPATTASEAAAGTADDMKNFLQHVVRHMESPGYGYGEISEFRLALSKDGGVFRSGPFYVILLDPEDGQVIMHGADKSVEDRRLLSSEDTESEDLRMLIEDANADTAREGVCGEYTKDGETRMGCAVLRDGRLLSTKETAIVVGYDIRGTELRKLEFEQLPGHDIPPLDVSADKIETAGDLEAQKEALKDYVHSVIDAYYIDFLFKRSCDFSTLQGLENVNLRALTRAQIKDFIPTIRSSGAGLNPLDYCNVLKTSLYRPVMRSEDGPWKSGSVYLFIMDNDVDVQRVLFNGLDAKLEDKNLKVFDEAGQDVGKLIIDGVRSAPQGEGVFVEYCWDDPEYEGDEVRDTDGNPLQGKAPGKSYKLSYVVDAADYMGLPPLQGSGSPHYIFGSGIYPKEGEGDLLSGCEFSRAVTAEDAADDGGCAVSGIGDTPQSTTFNLFLIVSALFLAISFGRRVRA